MSLAPVILGGFSLQSTLFSAFPTASLEFNFLVLLEGGVSLTPVHTDKEYKARRESWKTVLFSREKVYSGRESSRPGRSEPALLIYILADFIGKCGSWVNRFRSYDCSGSAHALTHNADRKKPQKPRVGRNILMIM